MHTKIRKLVILLGVVSCGEASTGPYYTTKSAAPTGLSVGLQLTQVRGGVADTLAIFASGDSVSASALLGTSGCMDYSAAAGQVDGRLIITVTETPADRICALIEIPTMVRTVVSQLRPGEYRVEYRKRIAFPDAAVAERILGRQVVRLP